MKMVTVYTAFNSADAQLIRSRLDAAKIPVYVAHEISSLSIDGASLAAGGIDVQVPDEHVKFAREIIESASENPSE